MRLSLLPNAPRRRGNDMRRWRFHPAVLHLEDRQLLSGYTLTTLASFNGTNGDAPYAGLVMDGQGNLYGTTRYGGADGIGAVFEIANGSNAITNVASFNGSDGIYPEGSLILDSQGNLYGTAEYGGASGDGAVFEIARGSNTIIDLASFDGTDGISPEAGLVMDGQGNLYGTTVVGGATGDGTVFEIASGSNAITTLASFSGTNGAYSEEA